MEYCIITISVVYLLIGLAILLISNSIYKNGKLFITFFTKIMYILFWPFFLKQIVNYCSEVLSITIAQEAYQLVLNTIIEDIEETKNMSSEPPDIKFNYDSSSITPENIVIPEDAIPINKEN